MAESIKIEKNKIAESIHRITPEEAIEAMNTRQEGLTAAEVKEKQVSFGRNAIRVKQGKSLILVFLSNFISLMAILLWIGGFIAFIAKMPELTIAIWMVNVINGVFSFWQEFRAEKAIEALKKMLPSYALVIRDGQEQKILVEDLVPGDIMLVQEGDKISADARVLESSNLQVNQSTLTGESNPVHKTHENIIDDDMSRFEIPNLIFTGTSVASGTAKVLVISIGMETEFGKIASLTQNVKEKLSPLEKELDKLTKQVSVFAVCIGMAFFIAAVFLVKEPLAKAFIFSLGMIVAYIPEGLLPTVTLSLAMAVQRMAKEHALVKHLSAVETLGCTTMICSDKTGTLTQNEMTVRNLWLTDQEVNVTGLGYAPVGKIMAGEHEIEAANNGDLRLLLTAAALCSNAHLVPPNSDNDRYSILGDPTEACMEVVAGKAGIDIEAQQTLTPRIAELPFDSRRKRMSTIHQLEQPMNGCCRIAYIKGAPKEILELCTSEYKQGKEEELTDEQRSRIIEVNDRFARKGLRVLAVACRLLSDHENLPASLSEYTPDLIEQNMIFIGLIAMEDPPRHGVTEAVELCHKASIGIIMITGDYGLTAESIAKQIGIVKGEHPKIVTGKELEKLSDDELKDVLKDEVIFARMAPEQKYRVVSNLQEIGHIVAVTGDGVNDSPALKKADIGIAMGISGTDVAKEAADMILTDDHFASIVRAIAEGRTVYSNIRKFILYILNSNMPEGVPSAAFLLSGGVIPLPLTVMQILSIDLGTDMLPALGLGTELPEQGIMSKPPRSKKEVLLKKEVIIKAFLWYGLLESSVAMAAYFFVNYLNGWPNVPLASDGIVYSQATTMTLAAIVFCQIGMVLNCRTEMESVFKIGLLSNQRVILGIVFEIILLSAIIYVPFLQRIFDTAPIGLREWIFLITLPPIILLIEEIRKAVWRRHEKI